MHERPKPKYPLRDLVKLWQEAKQKEQEADQRSEHWHRAYNSLKQDYLVLKDRDLCSSCQRVKDETEEGELSNCVTSVPPAAKPERAWN